MKLKLPLENSTTMTVVAQEVVLRKHKGNLRFFFHKAVEKFIDYDYVITEYASGCICSYGCSRKECIDLLKKRLEKYGEEYFVKQGKKVLKEFGHKYPLNKESDYFNK
jgi:hypothetical protein